MTYLVLGLLIGWLGTALALYAAWQGAVRAGTENKALLEARALELSTIKAKSAELDGIFRETNTRHAQVIEVLKHEIAELEIAIRGCTDPAAVLERLRRLLGPVPLGSADPDKTPAYGTDPFGSSPKA